MSVAKKSKIWIPALIALALILSIVFGVVKYSTAFPHNKEQESLVNEVVTYLYSNASKIDKATDDYKSVLDKVEPCLEDPSKEIDEKFMKEIYQKCFALIGYENEIREIDSELKEKIEKGGFENADVASYTEEVKAYIHYYSDQSTFIFQFLALMYEQPKADNYKTEKGKLLEFVKREREMCDLLSERAFYGINLRILPVNKEEALDKLKNEYLPKLKNISSRKLTLEKDKSAVDAKIKENEKKQDDIKSQNEEIKNIYNQRYNEYVK